MSFNIGPKISTEGLVLNLDPFENKSLPTKDLPVTDGLVLWLDADDSSTFEILSGNRIGKWCDKSPVGNDYIQHSVDMAPVFSGNHLNGRQGVKFERQANQSGERMTGNYTEVENYSIFWVMDAEGESRFHFISDANGNSRFYSNGGSQLLGFTENDASQAEIGGWNYDQTISTFIMESDYTPEYYVTGNLISSPSTTYNSTFKINQMGNIRGGGTSVYALDGTVNELLIFDREVTSTERKQIHTYLGHKWGINNSDPIMLDLSPQNNNVTEWKDMYIEDYTTGALEFDFANSGYLTIPNDSSIQFSSNSPHSISYWAKFNTLPPTKYEGGNTYYCPLSKQSFTSSYAHLIAASTSNILVYKDGSPPYINYDAGLQANQWYFIGDTYDGNTVRLYVDGVEVASATGTFNTTASDLYLGVNNTTSYWMNGALSLLRMYNRTVSPEEMNNIYLAQKSRFNV